MVMAVQCRLNRNRQTHQNTPYLDFYFAAKLDIISYYFQTKLMHLFTIPLSAPLESSYYLS